MQNSKIKKLIPQFSVIKVLCICNIYISSITGGTQASECFNKNIPTDVVDI